MPKTQGLKNWEIFANFFMTLQVLVSTEAMEE